MKAVLIKQVRHHDIKQPEMRHWWYNWLIRVYGSQQQCAAMERNKQRSLITSFTLQHTSHPPSLSLASLYNGSILLSTGWCKKVQHPCLVQFWKQLASITAVKCNHLQGVPKMTQLVFVRTSSNLYQIW